MTGSCEGGNEPPGFLKARMCTAWGMQASGRQHSLKWKKGIESNVISTVVQQEEVESIPASSHRCKNAVSYPRNKYVYGRASSAFGGTRCSAGHRHRNPVSVSKELAGTDASDYARYSCQTAQWSWMALITYWEQFSAGRQNVHDEERGGTPTIITDDLVEQRTTSLLMTLGP
ncbi:hypothetical protein ANN_10020 [Periplaneta americana]|uniref:Uncharacterized protein n=1 Tax=Periplaneta americana TaxID=6978 RepID=A0ABQ8TQK6_PERAM|nr:hypothetical protein ANN_10020 [Periplaneta americana]